MMESPQYKHDCSRCIFLGHATASNGDAYDLYFCDQLIGGATVISRWGNEGHEYRSGLNSSNAMLIEAEVRYLSLIAA